MQANVQETQQRLQTPRQRLDYKWIVAMVVIIGVFMSILDSTIVNIAIPRLQTVFGADLHSVQWVLTAYILTLGVVTPTTAFFSDRLGIKRYYIFSLALFTLGSALCGLAWSLPVLIFFRVLQGVGGASLFPLSLTLLFQEFPAGERGTAMGFFGVPALLAPALGPTLGGYIVTYADWRLIFYINVPIGIAAVILATLFLHDTGRRANTSFDIPGFIFATVGLATVLYGLSEASTDGWGSTTVVGCIAGGLVALAIFCVVELVIANRGGQPLLDLRLFANRPFTTSSIANLFVVFALYGGLFLMPVYLQNLRSLSAFQAGLILLPQAFASMVSVILGGQLVDRIGVRAVVLPGLLVLAIANWQLSTLSLYSTYPWIQLMLILRGFSLGMVGQPIIVSMMSEIRPRMLPQASAMSTVTRSVSSSLGIAVLATLVQTQSQVHYAHLAEQVTASSPLGQLLPEIEALFVAQGMALSNARMAALQLIAGYVQLQGYDLAIQDAFRLTLVFVFLAVVATLFIRSRRQPPAIPVQTSAGVPAQEEVSTQSEAALAAI